MNLLKRTKIWGIVVLLAMLAAFLPTRSLTAGELPGATLAQLTQVAELRGAGKTAEAIILLEKAAKEAPRSDPEAGASIQFVLADVYQRDMKDTKRAAGLYGRLALTHTNGLVDIPGVGKVNIQQESLKIQDQHNQGNWLYKVMDSITGVLGNNPVTGRLLAGHTGVLAILLLSVVIKVALTPLTVRSFRSMREMQKLQPLMKDLQQRFKDKPQELNRKMMELYKEHGVNPLSGCLPMLLQMPIIILLYRAIGLYQYPLSHESFLWVKSLAMGDLPLALIYAASLFASSKLTMMPTADPQQEQQQKMMSMMMPLMFFFLFKSYPAGFILGWLFFNVLTTVQQWHLMRGQEEGNGSGGPKLALAGGGTAPGGALKPQRNGNGSAEVQRKAKPQTERSIKRKKSAVSSPRGR